SERYGVPVYVPEWMARVEERLGDDVPTQRYTDTLADSGFEVLRCEPFPGWQEAMLYHAADGTLIVPDSLGTASAFTTERERLGVTLVRRLSPPSDLLNGVEPQRILVGHGKGIFENADDALDNALDGARRRAG
ncbi:MAG: hypothetical protein SXQ77_01585, partial [Halobacteria archaeon]|nr:hypothetical protein [Halobacteria archaeon]